jgi:alpha-D-xyloside xylohydrolase
MFGDKYLVAPIFTIDTFSRKVYLPEGTWQEDETGKTYTGGTTIEVEAPIDVIPVFIRK